MTNCSCDSFFVNFSNKARLNILLLLKNRACDVTTISKQLKIEQSLVSHNMRKLLSCNLVQVKRRGKNKVYSLNRKIALPILNIYEKNILRNCCSGCKVKKWTSW